MPTGSQVVIMNAAQDYTHPASLLANQDIPRSPCLHALVRPAALGYYCESFEHGQSYPCLTLWGPW